MIWEQYLDWVISNQEHLFPNFQLVELTFAQWNGDEPMPNGQRRTNFTAARRRQHRKAYENLISHGWEMKYHLLEPHLKSEILREVTDPRLVSCPRNYEHAAHFGPHVLSLSKALTKCWNKEHWIMYTSGARAEDISDFVYNNCERLETTFDDCYKIAADQSRQDAHVTTTALDVEEILLAELGFDPQIASEMNPTFNFGRTRRGVFYKVPGTRSTGVSATSVGNSLMNGLMTVFALYRQYTKYLKWDWFNPPVAVVIQGDDSLVLCKEDFFDKDEFVKDFRLFGFKVKFITVTQNVWDIDYCSRYFWPTDGHVLGYVLGPKIGKVLNKISCAKSYVSCPYSHNRGIYLSLQNDVNHIPFLRKWIKHLERLTTGYKATPQPYDFSIHSRRKYQICDRTWEFLYNLYGITELDETAFDYDLSGVTSLPYRIVLDNLEDMLEKDY